MPIGITHLDADEANATLNGMKSTTKKIDEMLETIDNSLKETRSHMQSALVDQASHQIEGVRNDVHEVADLVVNWLPKIIRQVDNIGAINEEF